MNSVAASRNTSHHLRITLWNLLLDLLNLDDELCYIIRRVSTITVHESTFYSVVCFNHIHDGVVTWIGSTLKSVEIYYPDILRLVDLGTLSKSAKAFFVNLEVLCV